MSENVALVASRLRGFALAGVMGVGYARGLARYLLKPQVRRQAVARAEVLLRGTARQGQHRRVARGQLAEQGLEWTAVRWFQLARDIPLRGLEHLQAAEVDGKGVLLVTTHCGWVQCLTWRMARAGYGYTAVSGGWIAHSTQPSDMRQMPMVNDGIAAGARHIIAGSGAFQRLDDVVRSGGRAGMAIDMPGSLQTELLGKPARLGQATFRIAWQNQAPVVPMFLRRRRFHLWVELAPAIWPDTYDTYEDFVAAVTDDLSRRTLPYAHLFVPKIIDTLWPGGSAEAALPNRATWAAKLAARA